jgi:hypothetical protein
MSLYANINARKKAGTSRSKANSTISEKNYKNMKSGFKDKGAYMKKANAGYYLKALKKKKDIGMKAVGISSSLTEKTSGKKSDVKSVVRQKDGKNTMTIRDSDKKRGRFHFTKSSTSKNGKNVHSKKSISLSGKKGKFYTLGYETYTDDKGKKKRRLTRRA